MKKILTLFIVVLTISKLTAQSTPDAGYGNLNTLNNPTGYKASTSPDQAGIPAASIANNSLQIYPNPASNQVTIASNQLAINEVRLNNALGQTLIVRNYTTGVPDLKETIDVSKLPAGLYFISVKSGNETSVSKIMVVR